MREWTQEGGKGQKGRRDGRESEENGSRNLAGASKSTPDDAKCVRNPRERDKNKKIRKLGDKV